VDGELLLRNWEGGAWIYQKEEKSQNIVDVGLLY